MPSIDNYRVHPHFDSQLTPYDNSSLALDAKIVANTIADLHDFPRTQMLSAQDRYESNINKSRSPAPAYHLGNQVFLWTKNIRTASTSCKLDWKWIGSCTVKSVISRYAYGLTLSTTVKVHSVFHNSLLDPRQSILSADNTHHRHQQSSLRTTRSTR